MVVGRLNAVGSHKGIKQVANPQLLFHVEIEVTELWTQGDDGLHPMLLSLHEIGHGNLEMTFELCCKSPRTCHWLSVGPNFGCSFNCGEEERCL